MNIRDGLNTKENYLEGLSFNKEAISYFEERYLGLQRDLESGVERHKKPTKDVMKSTLKTLSDYQKDILLATYSVGLPLLEFQKEYIKYVYSLIPIWYKGWGYDQMLWSLSIGILLEIDEETFDKLVDLIKKYDPEDYLIDRLIRQRHPDWPLREEFMFGRLYSFTRKIMEEEAPDKALALLKEYLTKKWYPGQRDTGWYDIHKENIKNHVGYWSFESGALCKIKGLDYTQLEGLPYFPYDLVATGSKE